MISGVLGRSLFRYADDRGLMRLIGHEVTGENTAEESEEMRFPGDVGVTGEDTIHHAAVEEGDEDGDGDPTGPFLNEAFHEQESKIAEDNAAGAKMNGVLATKEPDCTARDDDDEEGGSEKSTHAGEGQDQAEA